MKKDELAHGFSKGCILQGEFKKGGGKKKVLEMPKRTEVKQCLGNCPAKDAFCRERNLMQGPCTAALCCFLAVMKLRETKVCFFD